MTTLQATVQDGRIVPNTPLEWPDGTELVVTLRPSEDGDVHGDSPEAIARWLILANSIPAPTISDQEWEAMQQRRREYRDWQIANAPARRKSLLAVME